MKILVVKKRKKRKKRINKIDMPCGEKRTDQKNYYISIKMKTNCRWRRFICIFINKYHKTKGKNE